MQEKKKDAAETMQTLEELQMIIQDHRVCWEVLPEQIPVKNDAPLKVGFNLMLYGTHEVGVHPTPGCEKCAQIYRDLRKIAIRVIPKEVSKPKDASRERSVGYRCQEFESAGCWHR